MKRKRSDTESKARMDSTRKGRGGDSPSLFDGDDGTSGAESPESVDPEDNATENAGLASGGPTAEERLSRARAAEREGRFDEAVSMYQELLLHDPGDVKSRLALGDLYAGRGDSSLALEQFEAAKAAAPDDPEAISGIAAALADIGRFERAERELRRGLRLHPDHAGMHELLGLQYFRRGMYQQAETELRRALDLDPSLAVAYHHRGEALNQLGRVDEALDMLKRAVQLDPDNAKAYYVMGIVYDRKHQRREAEAMYRKAREVG